MSDIKEMGVDAPRHPRQPRREVHQSEALAWLAANPAAAGTSVITSLPDVSEVPPHELKGWQAWFVDAVARIVAWVSPGCVAIFYQSDIRHGGTWVDKGYLVQLGAERAGGQQVWHKIVCRRPPGSMSSGRPTYSHMICLAPQAMAVPRRPGPDVLANCGPMDWSRAMGLEAARVAVQYLIDETPTRLVVDPFCGTGTVLAVANDLGLDAVGVDLSPRRCRAARRIETSLIGAARHTDPTGAPGVNVARGSVAKRGLE